MTWITHFKITFLLDSGFADCESITILGMELHKNLADTVASNFEKIRLKIAAQINFWKRFNLSLPGRIEISKTMLYSQINYLGCFLNLNNEQYGVWESLIFSFVRGNLKISNKKIETQVKCGGLGLFSVRKFLDSQKCAWVLRAQQLPLDNWKIIVKSQMSKQDILFKKIHDNVDSTTKGILDAFGGMYKNFLALSNNYHRVPLLGNEYLTKSVRSTDFFSINDLDANWPIPVKDRVRGLKIQNLLMISTKQELEQFLGTGISRPLYNKLTGIRDTAVTRYKADPQHLGLSTNQFFRSWKRGSKKFRLILDNDLPIYVPKNLVKFANNVETVIDVECSEKIGKFWTNRAFSNSLRTFLFKFYNNNLPYNTILSHFVRGKSRNCTFCDLLLNQEIEDETPLHLFFDCENTTRLCTTFFSIITDNEVALVSRHEIFCCFARYHDARDLVLDIAAKMFLFYLWECKLRQHLGSIERLIIFFRSEVRVMTSVSPKIVQKMRQAAPAWNF
jgi:hypothetical protein